MDPRTTVCPGFNPACTPGAQAGRNGGKVMGTRCGWLLKPLQQEAMKVKVKMGAQAKRLRFQPPQGPLTAGPQGFKRGATGSKTTPGHPGTAQSPVIHGHWTPYVI